MRVLLPPTTLVLTLAASQTLPPPPAPDPAAPPSEVTAPEPFERLRYNPRERTLSGLHRLEQGDLQAAAESFETAGRLAAENPVARFNAGTADLLAGADGAVQHLEFAAERAAADLAPAAHFNLGNARLAAGDAGGAVDAYKDSLRLEPANRDVKHNLELALKALEQQEQQEQDQQQQQQQQQPSDEERSQDEQSQQQNDEGEQEQPQQQPGEAPPEEQPQEDRGDRKLPDFEDQPDMSAEQAAAILEAVENLERDERRRQAAERARRQSKKGKDW